MMKKQCSALDAIEICFRAFFLICLCLIYEGNIITTSDGKKPMLPMFSQGFGMLVNEDLFKKEKLSVPQNFDELIDVCKKLDVVSGTKKRESKSEHFQKSPFTYRIYPTPVTKDGGIFISNSGVCLAVNSKSRQLDVTNEFIRFLAQTKELNNLADIKRLIPITKNFSSDDFFAPMEKGEKVYANSLGILDEALRQIRKDCYDIGNGILTVDQAVESFGTKKTQ